MSPEYGSTCTLFPVDDETLRYLRATGRPDDLVALVETYAKEQGLWHDPAAVPQYDEMLELDLGVGRAVAGRARASAGSRVALRREDRVRDRRWRACDATKARRCSCNTRRSRSPTDATFDLADGAVVIAAITSCTNTSNPSVMIAAGLLARNAVARGLTTAPWVKTSLAPGSLVVTDYYTKSGLLEPLSALGLRRGRLRLHHVYRQLRSARARDLEGDRRSRSLGLFGAVGQPQLRRPHPSRRAHELPGFAAARRRVRARGHDGHRPEHRSDRPRSRRRGRVPARPLAVRRRGDERGRSGRRSQHVRRALRLDLRRRRTLARAARADRRPLRLGHGEHVHPSSAVPRRDDRRRRADRRRRERAGARAARRQCHDRPHLARGQHSRVDAGRAVVDRARRGGRATSTRTARGAATTK